MTQPEIVAIARLLLSLEGMRDQTSDHKDTGFIWLGGLVDLEELNAARAAVGLRPERL